MTKRVIKHTCFRCEKVKPESEGGWDLMVDETLRWICYECATISPKGYGHGV
jgi:hypothetical protein